MRRLLSFIACVLIFQGQCLAERLLDGGRIYLSVNIYDPTEGNVPAPSVVPSTPVVTQQGHVLSIGAHENCTLSLTNADGIVVFETYVPSSVSEVQLPSDLTGEFELRLYTTSFLFAGYIEL